MPFKITYIQHDHTGSPFLATRYYFHGGAIDWVAVLAAAVQMADGAQYIVSIENVTYAKALRQ